MEVHMDNMINKSQQAEDHVEHMRQTFEVLRQNQMKLNPEKCAFGISTGKFLGFMVHNRGIKANPVKIKAIMDLEPPRKLKQL